MVALLRQVPLVHGSCFINLHTFSTLFSTFFSTFFSVVFSVVFLWNVTLTPPQKFSTTGIGNIFHILALSCLHLAHISLQSYTFLYYYSMQNLKMLRFQTQFSLFLLPSPLSHLITQKKSHTMVALIDLNRQGVLFQQ